MSFLLDALSKADEDRRRAEVPELRSYHRRKPSAWGRAWRALLLLILLLGAFAGGYFARPWLEPVLAPDRGLSLVAEPVARTAPAQVATPAPPPQAAARLVLEVVSWSERPQARFAMINGVVVYEGDTLDSGEQVLRIESEAVVLQSAGETIRLTM